MWAFMVFSAAMFPFLLKAQLHSVLFLGGVWGWESALNFGLIGAGMWLMLVMCGTLSLLFSRHYFGSGVNDLKTLILGFLLTMAMLTLTGDLFSSLILWEYLGLISFILMLYYGNYDTCFAAKVTLISSRFGDVGLFLLVSGWMLGLELSQKFFLLSLFFIFSSKSAAVPLNSWLLEAMRAPTPVSALVHSSTLVAAGVWFVASYGGWFSESVKWGGIMACLVTMVLSAQSSLYFTDAKKIVALSTCKNISWCLLYCWLGSAELAVLQLMGHGVAKCLLFMAVGDILSSGEGAQNLKMLPKSHANSEANCFFVTVLVFLISGGPFKGVFFSKHLLFSELGEGGNLVMLVALSYCVSLTYLYSGRLIFLFWGTLGGKSSSMVKIFLPVSGLLLLSGLTNYTFVKSMSEVGGVGWSTSLVVLLLQILGVARGASLSSFTRGGKWFNSFGGKDLMINHKGNLFIILLSTWAPALYFRWEVGVTKSIFKNMGSLNHFFKTKALSTLAAAACLVGFLLW